MRSSLAVACYAGVDNAWVDFRDAFVVHVVLLQCAGEVVLDQNIAVFGQLVKNFNTCWGLEGEAYGFLVAVDGQEVCAFALTFLAAFFCVGGIRWSPGSGVVASGWMFDFDDFCAGCGLSM